MTTPQGRLGRWGEDQARRFLEGKGYTVSYTKYRSRWGEVDIVAQQGELLVFVEVKTRWGAEFGTAEESVTATKSNASSPPPKTIFRRMALSSQHGA